MLDLFARARETAEDEAIRVFGDNLKDLMLAAPAGPKAVMGLDPGMRTGVKVAVVDATGKLLATTTIYPHEPRRQWDQSLAELARLCPAARRRADRDRQRHRVARDRQAGGRADQAGRPIRSSPRSWSAKRARRCIRRRNSPRRNFRTSTSRLRGAVSIARRLQDPLAELVKIEPKAIGVGQYQHDVNQSRLARALDAQVEDCVNAVGVDVNTASAPLLARVAGLSPERRRKHRPIPRRARRVRDARGAEEGAAPRRQGVRAERRLPAHRARRQSARCRRRASGGLPGGRAHPRRRAAAR